MSPRAPVELPKNPADAGFTPSVRHLPLLFDRLASSDEKEAEQAEKALCRVGAAAGSRAIDLLSTAEPPLRSRLARLIGRIAQASRDAVLVDRLRELVADRDTRTRRAAMLALGKIGGAGVEDALIEAWPTAALPERRAIAEALGKIGGPRAIALLESEPSDDPELERRRSRALLMLSRTIGRETSPGAIELGRPLPIATRLAIRCRSGLAPVLADEARELGRVAIRNPGEIELVWQGPLAPLLELRTALDVGIVIPLAGSGSELEAVATTLTSEPALRGLGAWTRGTPRFRLVWPGGAHRRSDTWKIASLVAARTDAIVNDPKHALWEIVVDAANELPRLLMIPSGAPDTRFAYRVRDVPAASHPTIAAALARVAGVRADDVIWDPFVGSGLELVERARLGPYRRLLGTDTSSRALEAARENLAKAKLSGAMLALADARNYAPRDVTLILTNPPLGRRIQRSVELPALLDAFLENAARVLVPGGRLVWLTPFAARSAKKCASFGFSLDSRGPVDVGGFTADLVIARKQTSGKSGLP